METRYFPKSFSALSRKSLMLSRTCTFAAGCLLAASLAPAAAFATDAVQQYDQAGAIAAEASPITAGENSIAGIFTAEQDTLVESVTVYANASETNAEIAVYLLGDEAESPDEGALVAEQSIMLPHTGSHTVGLDTPVPVGAGQRYAVVQTLSSATNSSANDATAYDNFIIKTIGTHADLPDSGSLSIVHTNDTHGRYATAGAADAVNGFAAVAALAQDSGADLILDAGDTFHGTTFATVNQGEAVAELMDAAGYDATTPGNHDWSYGSQRLAQIDQNHNVAVLAANVEDETAGSPLFENEYLLREVALEDESGNFTGESATVGVFGVIDESFHSSTPPNNVENVAFTDSIEAANAAASQLRAEGADVVVALTHNRDPQAFAASTSGIDAVVAGHEHVAIDETVAGADGRAVAVVEQASSPAADYFGSIGLLSLEIADNENGDPAVASHDAQSFATADIARPHEEIDALAAQLDAENAELLKQVVGQSSRAYEYAASSTTAPGGWELVRTQDEPIGHVVTGAYLAQTGADIAFENAGGIRGGIPEGNVTREDILTVSPYGNALATYSLTGAQILDIVERSLALSADCRDVLAKQMEAIQAGEDPMQYSWPDSSGSVLAIGGAVMEVDWSKPDGQRVRSITIGNAPLDPNSTYTVATTGYVASATDLYPSFEQAQLLHEYGTCDEALAALIAQPEWEQLMAEISGKTTYVTDKSPEGEENENGENEGDGESEENNGNEGSGGSDETNNNPADGKPAGENPDDEGSTRRQNGIGPDNSVNRFAATADSTQGAIAFASLSALMAAGAGTYMLSIRRHRRSQ